MTSFKDLTGKQFGRLTAIAPTAKRINGSVVWKCSCSCGADKEVSAHSLRDGNTQSCGCLQTEWACKLNKTRIQDVSNTAINNIYVVRMSSRRSKIGKTYCWAICPRCRNKWEVRTNSLKSCKSEGCRKCAMTLTVSKTATALLDKLEELLGLKIVREYQLENKYFDGYIPELRVLIESDGTYWHQKKKNNDRHKSRMAENAGLLLIRITNDSPSDHAYALKEILQVIPHRL